MEKEELVNIDKILMYQKQRELKINRERDDMINRSNKLLGKAFKENSFEFMNRLNFEPVDPIEFYNSIFGSYLDITDEFNKGEYVAIAIEQKTPKIDENGVEKKPIGKRCIITDGLSELSDLILRAQKSKNFCYMSAMSYAGRNRTMANARFMFAMIVDLDNLIVRNEVPYGLRNMIYQISTCQIPSPTYIVCSGNGIHLYYVFDKPIPLYKNNIRFLNKIRKDIIKLIWNSKITDTYSKNEIQWESLFQAFRIVGTYCKDKINICTAFKNGNADTVSIEYLASFINSSVNYAQKIKTMPKYSYKELKELYPDWTDRHFTASGKPKKTQVKGRYYLHRAVYDNYYSRLPDEVTIGHRYYSLLCLASLAQKCQPDPDPEKRKNKPYVTREEFVNDCYKLFDNYRLKDEGANKFKTSDIENAIEAYDHKDLVRMTVEYISSVSGVDIKRNDKRRPKDKSLGQEGHLKLARFARDLRNSQWDEFKGKKTQAAEVFDWRVKHPFGTKSQCINDMCIDKNTVYKWWTFNLIDEILKWKCQNDGANPINIKQCSYEIKCNVNIVEHYWYYIISDVVYDKNSNGTPESAIKFWRMLNPDGTKSQCIKDTNLSRGSVYKYWNS